MSKQDAMTETDYTLRLTVKNSHLLRLMRMKGHETAAQLSRASGVSQGDIGGLMNLCAVGGRVCRLGA